MVLGNRRAVDEARVPLALDVAAATVGVVGIGVGMRSEPQVNCPRVLLQVGLKRAGVRLIVPEVDERGSLGCAVLEAPVVAALDTLVEAAGDAIKVIEGYFAKITSELMEV